MMESGPTPHQNRSSAHNGDIPTMPRVTPGPACLPTSELEGCLSGPGVSNLTALLEHHGWQEVTS